VSNVLGGNSFDILFLAFSDLAYRNGSIYQALTEHEIFILALTILITGILVLGLLRREKHGIGNIGFESFLVLLLYVGGFLLVSFS
ncbi:MAG TPA: cation transporter, partial [Cyanobacteria bacterium UBA11372]|nr:cation transporter [Cyanobacteria bacterium UBA11372]